MMKNRVYDERHGRTSVSQVCLSCISTGPCLHGGRLVYVPGLYLYTSKIREH